MTQQIPHTEHCIIDRNTGFIVYRTLYGDKAAKAWKEKGKSTNLSWCELPLKKKQTWKIHHGRAEGK